MKPWVFAVLLVTTYDQVLFSLHLVNHWTGNKRAAIIGPDQRSIELDGGGGGGGWTHDCCKPILDWWARTLSCTVSCNLSRNSVTLQVAMVCCSYYHRRARQIFLLQKVETASTFCNMKILLCAEVVIRATNNRNLKCNTVARQVARKCCPYDLGFTILCDFISTWCSYHARNHIQSASRNIAYA